MHTSVHTIVHQLFGCDHLEQVNEEQLRNFIEQYPYSSIGHILLAKKVKDAGRDYTNEVRTASLYISDPLWLYSFLVDSEQSMPDVSVESHTSIETTTSVQFPIEQVQAANESGDEQKSGEETIVVEETITTITEETELVPIKEPALSPEPVSEKGIDEQELVFEPYHTIDYFASQGIKLKPEELSKDKFGRQLKSFTDWLRSMKRIAPTVAEPGGSELPLDPSIQKNAEESVETSEIETEAMAEVWAKQGKPARAIAIYRKLSLLNPSKSHYFAAKIEQLNS
jgi:hypothetical protein